MSFGADRSPSKPAVDVEAKVENGSLGVGIFAPEDMISEEQVQGILDEIRRLMVNIITWPGSGAVPWHR